MIKHLAIFSGRSGEDILEGNKTIESRFSKVKNPPFRAVSVGDLVYIKPSGKEIIGEFRVKKVIFFDGVTTEDLDMVKKTFGCAIAQGIDYWEKIKNARYVTLIFIGDSSRFITSPVKIKKSDLRGWVVLQ